LHFKGKKCVWQATDELKPHFVGKTTALMRGLSEMVDLRELKLKIPDSEFQILVFKCRM